MTYHTHSKITDIATKLRTEIKTFKPTPSEALEEAGSLTVMGGVVYIAIKTPHLAVAVGSHVMEFLPQLLPMLQDKPGTGAIIFGGALITGGIFLAKWSKGGASVEEIKG